MEAEDSHESAAEDEEEAAPRDKNMIPGALWTRIIPMSGQLQAKDHAFEIQNDLSTLGTKKGKEAASKMQPLVPIFDPKERKLQLGQSKKADHALSEALLKKYAGLSQEIRI